MKYEDLKELGSEAAVKVCAFSNTCDYVVGGNLIHFYFFVSPPLLGKKVLEEEGGGGDVVFGICE